MGNEKVVSFGMGSADVSSIIRNLFPSGQLYVVGSQNPDEAGGPITGSIGQGTTLRDISVRIKSLFKR